MQREREREYNIIQVRVSVLGTNYVHWTFGLNDEEKLLVYHMQGT